MTSKREATSPGIMYDIEDSSYDVNVNFTIFLSLYSITAFI
jgi:hypothetical protein